MQDSPIWYKYDMGNEAHYIRCIKQLEFMVRKSMGYESWQKRTKYAVSLCPTCGESFEFVAPETHHHKNTLFDIVDDVLQKHIDLNDLNDATDYEICEEIMDLHYKKKVGYIVLCKHCHDKYHAGVPDILEIIDEAQAQQKKTINNFYTKEISGSADRQADKQSDKT